MKYIKVFILFRQWDEKLETGRKAGTGILVTSKERTSIKLGNLDLVVSSPNITIAGSQSQRADNEVSFWLSEYSTFEEYQTLPESYRGEDGCYLGFTGDLSSMKSKTFITNAEYDALQPTEQVLAFAS